MRPFFLLFFKGFWCLMFFWESKSAHKLLSCQSEKARKKTSCITSHKQLCKTSKDSSAKASQKMMPSRSEGDRIPFHSFNLIQQIFSTLTTISLNFFSIRELLKIEIPIILYSKLYLANIHQSHHHWQYKNVSSSFSRWKLEKCAFLEKKHCLCNKCLPVYIKQPPGLQIPQR